MGTWTTDVLGTGLAHTAPTKQERVLARRIAKRWAEWHPLLLHELRARPHPPGYVTHEMQRLEQVHAKAMMHLMDIAPKYKFRHIKRIVNKQLDDPRLTDEEREARIAASKDRGPDKYPGLRIPLYGVKRPRRKLKPWSEMKTSPRLRSERPTDE